MSASACSWRRLAFCLFAVAAGTNVPTPLLLIYRETLDLSPATLTALFGVYAAGLVPALAFAGPATDRLGRRRVVLPAAALAGLVSLVFVAAAHFVPLLFVARFLQGVASGVVFSVASVWLLELSERGRPGAGARRAAAAMAAGFSLGPLTSGLLGEFGPGPTTLPYLLHTTVVVLGLAGVRSVPETAQVGGHHVAVSGSPLRRGATRDALVVLAPVAVCVYAFPSVIISAVPVLVELPARDVAFTGLLGGISLGVGAFVAPAQRRLGRATPVVAATCGAAGFALAALTAATGHVLALLGAAALLGCGSSLSLAAGLSLLPRLAAPGRMGTLSAAFYATSYLGFAFPFLVASASRPGGAEAPLGVLALACAALAAYLVPAARAGRT